MKICVCEFLTMISIAGFVPCRSLVRCQNGGLRRLRKHMVEVEHDSAKLRALFELSFIYFE